MTAYSHIDHHTNVSYFNWSMQRKMEQKENSNNNNKKQMAEMRILKCDQFTFHEWPFNPFTPESDQCQNSPAASQEIWHHTVWRTWLFIAYSDEKWLYYKFSLHHSYNRFLKGWENTLFELRSERVDPFTPKSDQFQISPTASAEISHHTEYEECGFS